MPVLLLIIVLIAAWSYHPLAGLGVFAVWFLAVIFGKLRMIDNCDDTCHSHNCDCHCHKPHDQHEPTQDNH